ncbi:MAG: tetratricopeptide repeat protein [Spirochaetales bacterium]
MKNSTVHYVQKTFFIFFIVGMCCFTACKTVPTEIPSGITEAELLQLAQSSVDNNNTAAAKYYYNAVIATFGSNMSSLVVAEFELAHIDVKANRYDEAKPILERIISYYDDPELVAELPPEYKKLAQIDLEKCLENL